MLHINQVNLKYSHNTINQANFKYYCDLLDNGSGIQMQVLALVEHCCFEAALADR